MNTWKDHEIIEAGTLVDGSFNFRLSPNGLVDRIRISFFGETTYGDTQLPGIYAYSDIVNDIVGTIGFNYAYDTIAPSNLYSDPISPESGMNFFFTSKMNLNGTYNIIFKRFDGSSVASAANVYMLIEYFYE